MRYISRNATYRRECSRGRQVIQIQDVPHTRRNVVVGARCAAAHAHSAQNHVTLAIQGETTAKDVNPADLLSHERIGICAIVSQWALIGRIHIYGIRFQQSEETTAWRSCRVEICNRERQTVLLPRTFAVRTRIEAERICGVRFLCRNDTATRPLRTPIRISVQRLIQLIPAKSARW